MVDLTNSLWTSDLSWSHQEIGDVLMAQRKFQEALESYHKSYALAEWLAQKDRSNYECQSDLAIICEKTGEALAALRRFDEASIKFQTSLRICEKLAQVDPHNAEWAAGEALACLQIAKISSPSNTKIEANPKEMLTRARNILLGLKRRSPLSALNQNRLEEVQAALDNP